MGAHHRQMTNDFKDRMRIERIKGSPDVRAARECTYRQGGRGEGSGRVLPNVVTNHRCQINL